MPLTPPPPTSALLTLLEPALPPSSTADSNRVSDAAGAAGAGAGTLLLLLAVCRGCLMGRGVVNDGVDLVLVMRVCGWSGSSASRPPLLTSGVFSGGGGLCSLCRSVSGISAGWTRGEGGGSPHSSADALSPHLPSCRFNSLSCRPLLLAAASLAPVASAPHTDDASHRTAHTIRPHRTVRPRTKHSQQAGGADATRSATRRRPSDGMGGGWCEGWLVVVVVMGVSRVAWSHISCTRSGVTMPLRPWYLLTRP
mmetsp:Transcript_42509/g.106094  ORF Transcript_42509/g.106094 Transcript_42509/m.106094 type:complete len:253 (+) Transcript_42509:553-1311(+)